MGYNSTKLKQDGSRLPSDMFGRRMKIRQATAWAPDPQSRRNSRHVPDGRTGRESGAGVRTWL
jgi:hypothetical protein